MEKIYLVIQYRRVNHHIVSWRDGGLYDDYLPRKYPNTKEGIKEATIDLEFLQTRYKFVNEYRLVRKTFKEEVLKNGVINDSKRKTKK